MNRIEKRAAEALIIAPVIREIARRFGEKEALAILTDINQKEAFERGNSMAEVAEENVIEILMKDVATWGEGSIWEMDVFEKTATTFFFNVLRCPYYEKYRELGLDDLGVALSCCRDEPFARGLHPRLKLERTKTIMEGADCCDFRYYLQA